MMCYIVDDTMKKKFGVSLCRVSKKTKILFKNTYQYGGTWKGKKK